jgi:hypothetical protein|nr:MAG TPA: Protein of unknown function (DUF551) [Caudoviricetes sp.]
MEQTLEEKAYDYANEKTKFRKDVLKEVDADNYDRRKIDCIEDFQCGAEWQTKQSPWISVNERLPEPEEEVLLYDRDSVKHYAIGWLRKKKGYNKAKWFVTNGYVTDESITHWMPIIQPNH